VPVLTLVFQGIESVIHRETLKSALELFDVEPRVSGCISYKSLRTRRLGPAYIKDTAALYPVVLDAGFNNTPLSRDEAIRTANDYYALIRKAPQITSAIAFRHPTLPDHVAPEDLEAKIIPAWDGKDLGELGRILSETGSVAAPYEAVEDKRLAAVMRKHPMEGTRMLISHHDLLETKRAGFNTLLLGSWVHPGRFGEIAIWDGSKFHRIGKAKKAAAIESYTSVIQQAGLDIELIQSSDAREMNKLAAYAYISWAQSLESATLSSDKEAPGEVAEVVPLRIASASTLPKGVKTVRRTVALPIFEQEESEALEEGMDGTVSLRKRAHLRPSSETIRVCDSCFLASTCPAYEPASSCAFNFPIEVRTDAQVKSLLNSVMELQATRVAFARFAEEVNGGYPDDVVGKEMDRLFRMAEQMKRVQEKRERLTVSVESESSNGGTGVLSRIFGERAQVEQPPAIEADVVVAEIIED
jgi:hypothetical protein